MSSDLGPMQLCYSGDTFAIGFCQDCGRPVCGFHSSMRVDRRLCSDDLVKSAALEIELARREKVVAEQARWRSFQHALLGQLNERDDDIERFLLLLQCGLPTSPMRGAGPLNRWTRSDRGWPNDLDATVQAQAAAETPPLLAKAMPRRLTHQYDATADDPPEWTFDAEQVGAWIGDYPGTPEPEVLRLGRSLIAGWVLRDHPMHADGYHRTDGYSEYVLEDGHLVQVRHAVAKRAGPQRSRGRWRSGEPTTARVDPSAVAREINVEDVHDILRLTAVPQLAFDASSVA